MTGGETAKRIFVVAGEASGDLHLSRLMREISVLIPGTTFYGIGGPLMKAQGAELRYGASDLCVVGLNEIWERLGNIRKALDWANKTIRRDKPDAVILLDYPDFNLRLAKRIAGSGIPVIYYVSPQVWAWRPGRLDLIRKVVDKMLVIFPFEKPLYEAKNIPVEYVGHPLIDELEEELKGFQFSELRSELGFTETDKVVALMPGSRKGEIQHHLEQLLESAKIISMKHPSARFVLPVAPTVDPDEVQFAVSATHAPVVVTTKNATRVLKASDMAIVASGTSTLQAALLEKPMVIVYRVAPLGWFIYKNFFRKTPFIGLPNIVAGKQIVPELVQKRFQVTEIVLEIEKLLTQPQEYSDTVKQLHDLKAAFGEASDASKRAARAVLEVLNRKRNHAAGEQESFRGSSDRSHRPGVLGAESRP